MEVSPNVVRSEILPPQETSQELPIQQQDKNPIVNISGIEPYKQVIATIRGELTSLANEGFMTEEVANVLLRDYMVSAFKQVVNIDVR